MIRILIADDHPIVRMGLKQVIAETSDMSVVDEATDGQQVLDKVSNNNFDVVLLDITMPGSSGFDILKKLKNIRSKLPVLVLSIHPESQYGLRMLQVGASGYLTKDRAPNELIDAIRKVARGGKYITSSLAEILANNYTVDSTGPVHELLSNREFEILRMIVLGKTVKDIARELSLSVKTVSTYRSRIFTKMEMKTNAELIYYAINNNLIELK
jgi:two-component system, NarL family, invasion response regulator UvrY